MRRIQEDDFVSAPKNDIWISSFLRSVSVTSAPPGCILSLSGILSTPHSNVFGRGGNRSNYKRRGEELPTKH